MDSTAEQKSQKKEATNWKKKQYKSPNPNTKEKTLKKMNSTSGN